MNMNMNLSTSESDYSDDENTIMSLTPTEEIIPKCGPGSWKKFKSIMDTHVDDYDTEQEIVDPITGQPTGQFNMSSIPADLNNTEFSKTVRSSFDNFVNENKMDGLKSLAVDYGGFTYDEMDEMEEDRFGKWSSYCPGHLHILPKLIVLNLLRA